MDKLLRLFKKIKLAIKLKSLYIKKAYIPEIDLLPRYYRGAFSGTIHKEEMTIERWLELHNCKWKTILKCERDDRSFRWIIWYV